jgi:hypothetical protein
MLQLIVYLRNTGSSTVDICHSVNFLENCEKFTIFGMSFMSLERCTTDVLECILFILTTKCFIC